MGAWFSSIFEDQNSQNNGNKTHKAMMAAGGQQGGGVRSLANIGAPYQHMVMVNKKKASMTKKPLICNDIAFNVMQFLTRQELGRNFSLVSRSFFQLSYAKMHKEDPHWVEGDDHWLMVREPPAQSMFIIKRDNYHELAQLPDIEHPPNVLGIRGIINFNGLLTDQVVNFIQHHLAMDPTHYVLELPCMSTFYYVNGITMGKKKEFAYKSNGLGTHHTSMEDDDDTEEEYYANEYGQYWIDGKQYGSSCRNNFYLLHRLLDSVLHIVTDDTPNGKLLNWLMRSDGKWRELMLTGKRTLFDGWSYQNWIKQIIQDFVHATNCCNFNFTFYANDSSIIEYSLKNPVTNEILHIRTFGPEREIYVVRCPVEMRDKVATVGQLRSAFAWGDYPCKLVMKEERGIATFL